MYLHVKINHDKVNSWDFDLLFHSSFACSLPNSKNLTNKKKENHRHKSVFDVRARQRDFMYCITLLYRVFIINIIITFHI